MVVCPCLLFQALGISSSRTRGVSGSWLSCGAPPRPDDLSSSLAGTLHRQLARPARAGSVHGVPPALWLLPDERRRAEHRAPAGTASLAPATRRGEAELRAAASPRGRRCTYLRHLRPLRAVLSACPGEGAGGSPRLWELYGTAFCLCLSRVSSCCLCSQPVCLSCGESGLIML